MINVSKIAHRGELRIKIQFKRSADLIRKVKSIQGRRWSKTKNCWHLPYSKESFESLKMVFGDNNLIFPKKEKASSSPKSTNTNLKISPQKRSLVKIVNYQLGNELRKKVIGEKIVIRKRDLQWLEVFVPSDKKEWINVMNNINGRKWKLENVCWEIPNVKQSYRQLKNHIGMKYLQFDFNIEKDIPEEYQFEKNKYRRPIKIKSFDLLNNDQKNAIQQLEEKIILKRLSPSTMKSYRHHLTSIFLFHKNLNPVDITGTDIQKFILYQIRKKRISESTQNQIINAFKAYSEKVLKRSKEWIEIERPKKSRKFPNVLSTNEVVLIMNSINNLKHKLAMLLIYSAGLRRSELLNLKRKDIHLDRMTIHIKGGKGKKDRYVTLAKSVLPYLKKYLKSYNPNRWLFEGQNGGEYSASSLQRIFENALKNSNINSYATLHTLRHSYATHCVENGHNLKSVQEALGHGSLKTTEIYLHISSDALKKLKSPLDNLDLE